MALNAAQDTALAQRANLNIAAAVVARVGVGASDHLIGNVISDVRASHSIAELASAGGMSGLLGAVDTAIARNAETNRPFNFTDSRAAQLAGQGSGTGGFGWQGDGSGFSRYGLLQGGRGGRGAANDGSDGGGSGGGSSGGSRGSSGSTFAVSGTGGEPAGAPFWGSPKGMMMTRAYANDNNMNWAPPDLMKMGRPALQALKDTGLKGDGYTALRDPSGLHFDNNTIVAGARYMKAVGGNYDKAAKAMAKVDKFEQPPALRKEGQKADHDLMHSNDKNRLERQKKVIDVDKRRIKANPKIEPAVQEKWKQLHIEHLAGLKAEAGAKQDGARAAKDGAQAKNDGAQAKKDDAEAKQKGAANDDASARMAELLKKRQATGSAPKPPGK